MPPEMRLSRRGWVEKRVVTLKMRTSALARLMPLLSMSSQLASPCRTTRPPSPKSCKSLSRIRFICAHRCCLCRNSGVRAVYLGLSSRRWECGEVRERCAAFGRCLLHCAMLSDFPVRISWPPVCHNGFPKTFRQPVHPFTLGRGRESASFGRLYGAYDKELCLQRIVPGRMDPVHPVRIPRILYATHSVMYSVATRAAGR